jgi:hypothetical protein
MYIYIYHILYHISHLIISHHISYHVISYLIISYRIISYHIIYYKIYHTISYHVSYHISIQSSAYLKFLTTYRPQLQKSGTHKATLSKGQLSGLVKFQLPTTLHSFLDWTSVFIPQRHTAIAAPTCDLQVIKRVDVSFLLRLLTWLSPTSVAKCSPECLSVCLSVIRALRPSHLFKFKVRFLFIWSSCMLTFWHRNLAFKFSNILYVKCK